MFMGLLKKQIKELLSGQPIQIEWEDAGDIEGENAWTDLSDIEKYNEIPVKTVGFFLKATKKTIYFCNNIESSDKDSKCTAVRGQIPIGCINKINKLEVRDV